MHLMVQLVDNSTETDVKMKWSYTDGLGSCYIAWKAFVGVDHNTNEIGGLHRNARNKPNRVR